MEQQEKVIETITRALCESTFEGAEAAMRPRAVTITRALDAAGFAITPKSPVEELIATEHCWHLSYFQSLEPDPEFPDMDAPEDHFCCSIITSYEDEVKGWGPTAEAAMTAAHAAFMATLIDLDKLSS